MGGAGSAVNDCLLAQQVMIPILNLGLPDRFVDHGSREELLTECGLDFNAVREAVIARYEDVRLQTEEQSNVLQRAVRIASQ